MYLYIEEDFSGKKIFDKISYICINLMGSRFGIFSSI